MSSRRKWLRPGSRTYLFYAMYIYASAMVSRLMLTWLRRGLGFSGHWRITAEWAQTLQLLALDNILFNSLAIFGSTAGMKFGLESQCYATNSPSIATERMSLRSYSHSLRPNLLGSNRCTGRSCRLVTPSVRPTRSPLAILRHT